MDKKRIRIKKVINKYQAMLAQLGVRVDKTILFGSFATGTARKDSDIDLIIVSDDFKKMNLRERLEVLGIAAVRIMQPIEALGYTVKELQNPSKSVFLKHILKTGKGI